MSLVPSNWRRAVVGAVAALLMLMLVLPHGLRAQDDAVLFANGHRLSNEQGFLRFWREHNGELMLGAAISMPVEENGLIVQYFERGRLELHPELEGSPILLGRVGADYAAALWRTFEPPLLDAEDHPDVQRFVETGHTLREPFRSFWHGNGGVAMLGLPISEPLWEYVGDQMIEVQYFERARLEYRPQAAGMPDAITISALGRDVALLRNVNLAPPAPPAPAVIEQVAVPQAAPAEAVAAPQQVAAPAPKAAPKKPAVVASKEPKAPARTGRGSKYIVVDISQQHLYAYEGDTLVFEAPVSTGRDGFNTPPGTFSVYAKLAKQTMDGTIGGEYYNVPNVPHVMYINGGVALHGTYWHNQFGIRRMSHGCINLPLKSAAWLYNWAPMGTTVTVQR